MNILAFLTDRRSKGSGKGMAARKLARKVQQDARDWAQPTMLHLIPRLIKMNGGEHIEDRGGLYLRHAIEGGFIAYRQASAEHNREWSLEIAVDGAGGFEWRTIEGSLTGFASHHDLTTAEITDLINEAERTGYAGAQEAMIERLGR